MNFAENTVRYAQISAALSRSRFRSRFRLGLKPVYLRQGMGDHAPPRRRAGRRAARARLYPE